MIEIQIKEPGGPEVLVPIEAVSYTHLTLPTNDQV